MRVSHRETGPRRDGVGVCGGSGWEVERKLTRGVSLISDATGLHYL